MTLVFHDWQKSSIRKNQETIGRLDREGAEEVLRLYRRCCFAGFHLGSPFSRRKRDGRPIAVGFQNLSGNQIELAFDENFLLVRKPKLLDKGAAPVNLGFRNTGRKSQENAARHSSAVILVRGRFLQVRPVATEGFFGERANSGLAVGELHDTPCEQRSGAFPVTAQKPSEVRADELSFIVFFAVAVGQFLRVDVCARLTDEFSPQRRKQDKFRTDVRYLSHYPIMENDSI